MKQLQKHGEVKLAFTPIGNGFGLNLRYTPYYQEQKRSIKKYRWGSDGGIGLLAIGILELYVATMALFPDKFSEDDLEFRESLKENQGRILSTISRSYLFTELFGLDPGIDVELHLSSDNPDIKLGRHKPWT